MQDADHHSGESKRSDGGHRRTFHAARNAERPTPGPADDPSEAALAKLDRVVLDAIAGSGYALEEIRVLWPVVQLELSPERITEAREEYLRAALTIWTRYLAQEISNPELAVAALEVMCLLFDD